MHAGAPPQLAQLGALRSQHGRSAKFGATTKFAAPLMLLIGFFLLLSGAVGLLYDIDIETPLTVPFFGASKPTDLLKTSILLSVLGAVCVGMSVYAIVRYWMARDLELNVHEHGMSYRRNGKFVAFTWGEITSTQMKLVRVNGVPAHVITVHYVGQQRLRITTDVAQFEQVLDALQRETMKVFYPQAMNMLREGHTLAFGPFSIAPQALVLRTLGKEHQLQWSNVQSVTVANGYIHVLSKSPSRPFALMAYREVPNPHVFIALATDLSGTRTAP